MGFQDVHMKNSITKACVRFYNGSELNLVLIIFTKKNNVPYAEDTFTLAGVGDQSTTDNTAENVRIYTVPLVEYNGEIVYIKAFFVNNILSNKVGREKINLNPGDFSYLNKEDL